MRHANLALLSFKGVAALLQGATHISKEYALGLQRGLTPLGLGYKYRLFYGLCPLSLYLDWSSMLCIEDWWPLSS